VENQKQSQVRERVGQAGRTAVKNQTKKGAVSLVCEAVATVGKQTFNSGTSKRSGKSSGKIPPLGGHKKKRSGGGERVVGETNGRGKEGGLSICGPINPERRSRRRHQLAGTPFVLVVECGRNPDVGSPGKTREITENRWDFQEVVLLRVIQGNAWQKNGR